MKIQDYVNILKHGYSISMSLKELYDKTLKDLGDVDGKTVFYMFVKGMKKNKDFMEEFNKTCFIENIHGTKYFKSLIQ